MNITELHQIPAGTYHAIVGGHVSVFEVNGTPVSARFSNGVRGFNIPDTVTVLEDGSIRSNKLGNDGKIV